MSDKITPTATLESWDKPLCAVSGDSEVYPCRVVHELRNAPLPMVIVIDFRGVQGCIVVGFDGVYGGNFSIRNIAAPKKKKIVPWTRVTCPWPEQDILFRGKDDSAQWWHEPSFISDDGLHGFNWGFMFHQKEYSPDRGKTWLPCGIEVDDD